MHPSFGSDEVPALTGLWGSGPQDIFAVGRAGGIIHWDGRAWRKMASGTERDLVAVAGRAPNDVYAVAQSEEETQAPLLLHYDGRQITDPVIADGGWRAIAIAGATQLLFGDRACPPTAEPIATFALASAGGWTALPPVSGMTVELAFVPQDGVPVALSAGGFARYAGGGWTPAAITTQPPNFATPFRGVATGPAAAWGASSRDFYVFLEEGIITHVVGDRVAVELALDCRNPDSLANPDVARYCARLR